jgi:hypothetical protein
VAGRARAIAAGGVIIVEPENFPKKTYQLINILWLWQDNFVRK